MFCFLLLLLIKVSMKHVVASAQVLVVLVCYNCREHVSASYNCREYVLASYTVPSTFPLLITVGNTFPLVITVRNLFPLLITVGKDNGTSFF